MGRLAMKRAAEDPSPDDGMRVLVDPHWPPGLSREAAWRQLSVRRLMIMLRRLLERQMQWAVFEPNGPRLRARLTQLLTLYLRGLFRAGAFRGAAEEEAFFVQCDEETNPPESIDAGIVVTLNGIAPVKPAEFIVFRVSQYSGGTEVETQGATSG